MFSGINYEIVILHVLSLVSSLARLIKVKIFSPKTHNTASFHLYMIILHQQRSFKWRFMIFASQKIFCHFSYPDFQNLFNIEKDISLTAL